MAATGNPRLGVSVNTPYILAQSAVPVCLVSSGTMGNNGALSGITALPTTYSGGIWLRLPANAIHAGSAAGLYWAVMSSTTAGTVYNVYADPASPFTPYIPAANTPFVSTGPGAFTQTTASDITLVNVTVPGGAMGLNGSIRSVSFFENNNSGGAKQMKVLFGGSQASNASRTTSTQQMHSINIQNAGVANIQRAYQASQGTLAGVNLAINTSADASLVLGAQLAVATDYVICSASITELLPS